MPRQSVVIEETGLAVAWARAFLRIARPGVTELAPLVVVVQELNEASDGDANIREALDRELAARRLPESHSVANTIFPQHTWNHSSSREELFARYERMVPRLHRWSGNRYGLYFERLTEAAPINQLERILQIHERGVKRRTALQATLFRPGRDLTFQQRRGFPCLDQVAFAPTRSGLEVSAFYTMQYIFDRAYGNLLGLTRLGRFMAQEMGLELGRLTCVAATGQLGQATKGSLGPLIQEMQAALASIDDGGGEA